MNETDDSSPTSHMSKDSYLPSKASKSANALGVSALILGAFSIFLLLFAGVIGTLFSLVTVVLAIISLKRIKRGEASNKTQAQIGLLFGLVGIGISIFFIASSIAFLSGKHQQISQLNTCLGKAHTAKERAACRQQFAQAIGQIPKSSGKG